MNKRQKVNHMKRQQGCAVALILGCVFAAPSNARQNPQATVGPVTQFCGERVCPTNLSTTPKVVERGTARRHRVVRAALPKPRPMDANGNPGHGLVTVATAAGIIVTRKTMSVASPESAAEVEIGSALRATSSPPHCPSRVGCRSYAKRKLTPTALKTSKPGWKRPSMRSNNKQEQMRWSNSKNRCS